MALQNSGVISLNDVHKELDSASGVSCSPNDADFRAFTNILGFETISLEDFYGLSSVVTVTGKPEIIFNSGAKLGSLFMGVSLDHTGYYDLQTAGTLIGTDILQDIGSVEGNIIYESRILGSQLDRGFQIASIRSLHAVNLSGDVKYLILSLHTTEGVGPLQNEGWDNLKIWSLDDDYQGANPTENPDLLFRRVDAHDVEAAGTNIDYSWNISGNDMEEFFGRTTSKRFYAKLDDAGLFTWSLTSTMYADSDSFTIASMNHRNPPSQAYVQAITQITCDMSVEQLDLTIQDIAINHDTATTDSRKNGGGTFTPSQNTPAYFVWNNSQDGQKVEMRWKVKNVFVLNNKLPAVSSNNMLFGQIGQQTHNFWNTGSASNLIGYNVAGSTSDWVDVTPELMGGSNSNTVIAKFGVQIYSRVTAQKNIIARTGSDGYIELQIQVTAVDGSKQVRAFRKANGGFHNSEFKVSSSTGNQDY